MSITSDEAASQPLLRIDRLQFTDGTEIEIGDSEIVVLVGPNNSGKTRTLQEIQQFISHRPGWPMDRGSFFALNEISVSKSGTGEEAVSWLKEHRYAWKRPDNQQDMIRTIGSGEGPIEEIVNFWNNPRPELGPVAQHFIRTLFCGERLGYLGTPSRLDIGAHPDHAVQLLARDPDLFSSFREAFGKAFRQHIIMDAWGNSIKLRLSKEQTQDDFTVSTNSGLPDENLISRLSKLQLIETQSDGVRSFTGILLTLLTAQYPLVLIDEPEAFLHPPQARLLGRYLAELHQGGQIFVSTHSLDVLLGLIEARPDKVVIIRLTRQSSVTSAAMLASSDLSRLWADPLLRFSRVLDGIFHDGVVVCEGDTDALFYGTVADRIRSCNGGDFAEIMFTYAASKQRIPLVTKALRALKVPVKAIVDFDALNAETTLRSLVTGLGSEYIEDLEHDRKLIDSHIRGGDIILKVGTVRNSILSALGEKTEKVVTADMIGAIRSILEPDRGWKSAKKTGKYGIPSGDASSATVRLLADLTRSGLFVVPCGEVESFVKTVGGHGPQWVLQVIERNLLESTPEPHDFIKGVLAAFGEQ